MTLEGLPTRRLDNFKSIDAACEFLATELFIDDGVIDDAIIKMHAHKHTVAVFNGEGKLDSTRFY